MPFKYEYECIYTRYSYFLIARIIAVVAAVAAVCPTQDTTAVYVYRYSRILTNWYSTAVVDGSAHVY